jgi:pyrroloquinoline-quinone synthase
MSLVDRLREEGLRGYHHQHPFHVAMHEGRLSRQQLQSWVANRHYYQTRIPIKDAIMLSKSEDPQFRRLWIRRIVDHDGAATGEGGIALWERLARAVGVEDPRRMLKPGVRFACDAYVNLVRESSLVEAVASSLTEFFAPELLQQRIAAWERHYPWVAREALEYFRQRVPRAGRDSDEAVRFVVENATTKELQDRCVAALVRKTEILWHLLDCLD